MRASLRRATPKGQNLLVLAAVVLVVDPASKFWAVSALSEDRDITLIPM